MRRTHCSSVGAIIDRIIPRQNNRESARAGEPAVTSNSCPAKGRQTHEDQQWDQRIYRLIPKDQSVFAKLDKIVR
jgi:hypothetical protein